MLSRPVTRTAVALAVAVTAASLTLVAQSPLAPLAYTISFPTPASKTFTVDIDVPTEKKPSVDLMMAIWSPGFYGIQNYADRITAFAATAPDGTALDVAKPNAEPMDGHDRRPSDDSRHLHALRAARQQSVERRHRDVAP